MERVEAELFTDGGNSAVVRLPPRRFSGVLIQGDSPLHHPQRNCRHGRSLRPGRHRARLPLRYGFARLRSWPRRASGQIGARPPCVGARTAARACRVARCAGARRASDEATAHLARAQDYRDQ
ncbi:DUF6959 family protein [Streptomyces sp. NBC_00259]|uniref:DUF6959 family protein n=1 Tax=Streptomyces sp. NBC_00259 TaxID=2903643 RepID=UPI003FA693F6